MSAMSPSRRLLLRVGATLPLMAVWSCQLPGSGPPPREFRVTPTTTFDRNLPRVKWALVVDRPEQLSPADLRYALLAQPFRSSWVVIWTASSLADLRAGHTPPEPAQPTQLYPADDRRYHLP